MNLYQAYQLVEQVLALEDPGPVQQRGRAMALRQQRRSNLQVHQQSLLTELAEFTHQHPGLRSIFLPMWEERFYPFGSVLVLTAPPRWHDPLVQQLRERYLYLQTQRDDLRRGNSSLALDLVYQQISHPNLRQLMVDRKMQEHQYHELYHAAQEAAATATATKALATRPRTLAKRSPSRNQELPVKLAAANLGISTRMLAKARREGQESEVEAKALLIEEECTSWALANRVAGLAVADSWWSDIVDVARELRMSTACMARSVATLQDVPLVLEAAVGLEQVAVQFAWVTHQPLANAWNIVMAACTRAGGDVERATDMLRGQYPWPVSLDNPAEVRQSLRLLVGDATPGCQYPWQPSQADLVVEPIGIP